MRVCILAAAMEEVREEAGEDGEEGEDEGDGGMAAGYTTTTFSPLVGAVRTPEICSASLSARPRGKGLSHRGAHLLVRRARVLLLG